MPYISKAERQRAESFDVLELLVLISERDGCTPQEAEQQFRDMATDGVFKPDLRWGNSSKPPPQEGEWWQTAEINPYTGEWRDDVDLVEWERKWGSDTSDVNYTPWLWAPAAPPAPWRPLRVGKRVARRALGLPEENVALEREPASTDAIEQKEPDKDDPPRHTNALRSRAKRWLAQFIDERKHVRRDDTVKEMVAKHPGLRGALGIFQEYSRENPELELSKTGRPKSKS